MTIRGADQIREAYRDQDVASHYVRERFLEPLGALLHREQVRVLTQTLTSVASEAILEIAPGPARLTADLAPDLVRRIVLLDASRQMLTEARRRLEEAGRRARGVVQGDAFRLPMRGSFDAVYTFRLIRHFDLPDRLRLYQQVARLLRPGGYLVFDAVNKVVSGPLRARHPDGHQHYDALLNPEAIRSELRQTGFEIVSMQGIQYRYSWLQALQVYVAPRSARLARLAIDWCNRLGGEPLEWVVTCRRA